jgi:hypothetical protein
MSTSAHATYSTGPEALVEPPRLSQPLDQRLGHRRAGDRVTRMLAQHLRIERPVLEELRRQLDEVAQHARARQPLVGDLRQEPVQPVAEFVEQRAHVVGRQQRRLAGGRLGEIVVVHDDRLLAERARLVAVGRHPRAAALGRPHEVVGQEQAHARAARVPDLVGAHVRVVGRGIGQRDEADAEQPAGAVERRLEHAVEREVRLHLGVVDLEARAAHLLGVVAPVPRLDRVRRARRARKLVQRVALDGRLRLGRAPHALEQPCDGRRRLRHPVDQRIVGVGAVAVQERELVPQLQDLARDRPVVVRRVELAAARPERERALAQVAAVGPFEERRDQRARDRDPPGAGLAALPGRLARRVAQPPRQAGEVAFVDEQQALRRLVVKHVLPERRRQRRQALGDRAGARARLRLELRAGHREVEVHCARAA